jgi:hypothetical protein
MLTGGYTDPPNLSCGGSGEWSCMYWILIFEIIEHYCLIRTFINSANRCHDIRHFLFFL